MNVPRIIFMGTPEFAVPSLEILVANGLNVVAVVTAPDKPRGRGLALAPSPVKACALRHHVPVLQPANLKAPEFQHELKSYAADIQVVVAFRMLPEAVWGMPSIGTFNLHASLLPQYRGAAPIHWAIINGEKETGLTTFFLRQEIDTGNIIFQEREPIHDDDDAGTLYVRLMTRGAQLVLKTVRAIAANNYSLHPQSETATLTPAPKIFRDTCRINWDQPDWQVRNFVRGLSPYPAAWTLLHEKTFKIFRVNPVVFSGIGHAGDYATDHKTYLYVKTSPGWVAVEEFQPEGKKRMNIEEFFRGNKL
jgi:methionyl-tRNA formyltransferase